MNSLSLPLTDQPTPTASSLSLRTLARNVVDHLSLSLFQPQRTTTTSAQPSGGRGRGRTKRPSNPSRRRRRANPAGSHPNTSTRSIQITEGKFIQFIGNL